MSHTDSQPAAGVVAFGRLAVAFFGLILALILFTCDGWEYACKFSFAAHRQLLFFALGVISLFALCFCTRIATFYVAPRVRDPRRAWNVLVVLFCIALFAYQLVVVWGCWFKTDWDARALATVDDPQSIADYLSQNPNQRFLYGLFRAISFVGRLLGSPDTYLSLVVGSCLCVTLAVFFAAHAARGLRGIRAGVVTLVVLGLLVGASPWILVPYSDTYGMLCPAIGLWCYVCHKNRWQGWFGLGAVAVLGYAIKPTTIFILAAALFVEMLTVPMRVARMRREASGIALALRRTAPFAAALVAGVCLSLFVTNAVSSRQVQLNKELELSMTHYLMMGLNSQSMGVYNADDALASAACATSSERSAMNVRVWKQRIHDLGPLGLLRLYHQKLLSAFSDGTFAWGIEGQFWIELHGNCRALKAYYGIGNFNHEDPNAQNGMWFEVLSQTLWIGCIAGVVLLGFSRRLDAATVVPMLAVCALALFLMVFETRARYVFLFAPYFCVLGVAGWSEVVDRVSAWLAAIANE